MTALRCFGQHWPKTGMIFVGMIFVGMILVAENYTGYIFRWSVTNEIHLDENYTAENHANGNHTDENHTGIILAVILAMRMTIYSQL